MSIETWKRKAIAAVFPQRCLFCRKLIDAGDDFCKSCAAGLPKEPYLSYAIGGFPCSAALLYIDRYAETIKRYKFNMQLSCTNALGTLLTSAAGEQFDMKEFDCVTCVPMHNKTLRRRGFNQSEALAKECAALTGIPFERLLIQLRPKESLQHTLARADRLRNVKGLYRIAENASVKGKQILLIDDIITTGSTLGECALTLKKGGCRKVCCAVVCATMY